MVAAEKPFALAANANCWQAACGRYQYARLPLIMELTVPSPSASVFFLLSSLIHINDPSSSREVIAETSSTCAQVTARSPPIDFNSAGLRLQRLRCLAASICEIEQSR